MDNILYEDNHVLVVRKPANLPCVKDESGDMDLLTLLKNDIKERYHKPGNVYIGLVHRLDRPVEGLMVYARTSKAAQRLSEQVQKRTLHRTYYAVLRKTKGTKPLLKEGRLFDLLKKDERTNTTSVVKTGGKEARLNYLILEESEIYILVRIVLETGRSHQIRVQFSSRGYPLYGDARYGNGKPGEQIALFSGALSFLHPTKQQDCFFTDVPPQRFPFTLFQNKIMQDQALLKQNHCG